MVVANVRGEIGEIRQRAGEALRRTTMAAVRAEKKAAGKKEMTWTGRGPHGGDGKEKKRNGRCLGCPI